jgi:hypothetical protein
MTNREFKQVIQVLLKRHYGMETFDTNLCEEKIVQACIDHGIHPFEIISEQAEKVGLQRIDTTSMFYIRGNQLITEKEEREAIALLAKEGVIIDDQMTLLKPGKH